MSGAALSRNGFFGFLTKKKVTYHRDVAKERKQRKAEAFADRKEALAVKKLQAEERAAEAKILQAQRKIDAARQGIKSAEKKVSGGAISEARFEQMKAHMQSEIAKQEQQKRALQNPAVSGAQYRLAQAVLAGTARSKMPRKVAHEIVSRTPAKLRSKFMKGNPTYPRLFSSGGREEHHSNLSEMPKPPHGALALKFNDSVSGPRWIKSKTVLAQLRREDAPLSYTGRGLAIIRHQNPNKKGNPAADAAELYTKFHGRPPSKTTRIEEPTHVHRHLTELGDLVRLVIDTPTGLVSVLNFNTSDPKKIVKLASSEKDPATGKIVGKQLYLRGGDQEVNLKGLKMDSPLWIRDLMELGRLHEFKRGDPPLIVDGEKVKGSITYRTRKGMDNFKLIDYWHRAGEETAAKAGPAARSLVLYDFRNKKIQFAGGQYHIEEPGIIN